MQRSVEWYLSKGFERPVAEYYAAGKRRITAIESNSDYSLNLHFDNGEFRVLDCKPFIKPNTVFAPLMDYERFRRVYLDEDCSVCWDIDPDVDSKVHWNNKVDICPDRCYLDSTPVK